MDDQDELSLDNIYMGDKWVFLNDYLFICDAWDSIFKILKYSGRNSKLSMLDLLLSVEIDGRIDTKGVQEEVDTFTFEVIL